MHDKKQPPEDDETQEEPKYENSGQALQRDIASLYGTPDENEDE